MFTLVDFSLLPGSSLNPPRNTSAPQYCLWDVKSPPFSFNLLRVVPKRRFLCSQGVRIKDVTKRLPGLQLKQIGLLVVTKWRKKVGKTKHVFAGFLKDLIVHQQRSLVVPKHSLGHGVGKHQTFTRLENSFDSPTFHLTPYATALGMPQVAFSASIEVQKDPPVWPIPLNLRHQATKVVLGCVVFVSTFPESVLRGNGTMNVVILQHRFVVSAVQHAGGIHDSARETMFCQSSPHRIGRCYRVKLLGHKRRTVIVLKRTQKQKTSDKEVVRKCHGQIFSFFFLCGFVSLLRLGISLTRFSRWNDTRTDTTRQLIGTATKA